MDNRENKVQVSHLTKQFGDLLVLNDISFNVKKGEFLCIVGPTGSEMCIRDSCRTDRLWKNHIFKQLNQALPAN